MNPLVWLTLGVLSHERRLRAVLGPCPPGPSIVGESATVDLVLGMLAVAQRLRRRAGHPLPELAGPGDLPEGLAR